MGGPAPRAPGRDVWSWLVPVLVAIGVSAIYTWYSAVQWASYEVPSFDTAYYAQMFQGYAAFRPPIVEIGGVGFNALGDHFSPLLVLLTPLYWVAPHAFALIVAQNVGFGVAAGILTWSARRHLGATVGTLLGIAFGLSWGLGFAVQAQFHEVALGVPLLAAALAAFVERRRLLCAILGGALALVREDQALIVIVLGVVLSIRTRQRRWLALSAGGAAWWAFTVLVALPLISGTGRWVQGDANLSGIGGDSALGTLLATPKLVTIAFILAAGALIALRSPLMLLMLPTLGWRFLSANPNHWGPEWHYSAILMPILYFAIVDGTMRARQSQVPLVRRYSRYGAGVAAAVGIALVAVLPVRNVVLPPYGDPGRQADAAAAIAAVPAGASVDAASTGLITYLVDDHEVSWWAAPHPPRDCIVSDTAYPVLDAAAERQPGTRYRLVHDGEFYQVACRA